MSPKKIVIFMLGVLLTLLWLTFVSREYMDEENEVAHGIRIGSFQMKYPTFWDIFSRRQHIENDKAMAIVQGKTPEEKSLPKTEDTLSVSGLVNKTKFVFPEDMNQLRDSIGAFLAGGNSQLVSNVEGRLYYPEPAQDFVKKLHAKLSQPSCRILHYGDSKIEGDRITAYLRNGLQTLYGGTGPGYFPIKMPYGQRSIIEQTSGNWYRYALFNAEQRKNKDLLQNNQYGLYANVCRFAPARGEAAGLKTASFTISPSHSYYNRLSQYTDVAIHYGNCTAPAIVTVFDGNTEIKKDTLVSDGAYHAYKLKFLTTPKKLRVQFSSTKSPDFYGVTVGSGEGVQMDNIPTRGDSGFHFTRIQDTYDAMSRELKPDIIIFQFGGNLVPYLTKNKVASSVKRIITNMQWVQKRNPDALFLLIGPSDMLKRSTKTTYEILPELVAEMKKQTAENGFAFFSMYEAMGGKNSMKIWYDNRMAASDLVHFSDKGTERMAQLLFQSLVEDLLSVQPPQMYRK
nr:SGNH/GDSL hydrolase family protein [uncultured Capnocytophaga sp.]